MTHAERWAPYHRAMAHKFALQRDMYRAEAAAERLLPDGIDSDLSGYLEERAVWCGRQAAEHAKLGEVGADRSPASGVIEPGGEAGHGVPPSLGSRTEAP